jgi:hypothetical protein
MGKLTEGLLAIKAVRERAPLWTRTLLEEVLSFEEFRGRQEEVNLLGDVITRFKAQAFLLELSRTRRLTSPIR